MPRSKDYTFKHNAMKAHRLRGKHWDQAELAKETDLSVGQVSRIEAGKHQPQLKNVIRIADALGVSVDDLVEWHVGSVDERAN